MINGFIGIKQKQTQAFLEDGVRIPVTEVFAPNCPVIAVRTQEKEGYTAIQLGSGQRKNANKGLLGHVKAAKLEKAPRFLREVSVSDVASLPQVGDIVKASDVLQPGDIVQVTGTSKGKGFAGVVKRHHFRGGPRTHGQSDRERAPGSIGQTTTPGRVYKGKRMAGRMGYEQVSVNNLSVIGVSEDTILLKGLVPGSLNSMILIKKTGTMKKFVPLFQEPTETPEAKPEEPASPEPEKPTEATNTPTDAAVDGSQKTVDQKEEETQNADK